MYITAWGRWRFIYIYIYIRYPYIRLSVDWVVTERLAEIYNAFLSLGLYRSRAFWINTTRLERVGLLWGITVYSVYKRLVCMYSTTGSELGLDWN